MNIKKVTIQDSNTTVSFGYLVEIPNRLIYNLSGVKGNQKIFSSDVINLPDALFVSNEWEKQINKMIKKGVFFDPWAALKDVIGYGDFNFGNLIHEELGITFSVTANRSNSSYDGNDITLKIADNSLEVLLDVLDLYLEHLDCGEWDDLLFKKIFSTKKGKDCSKHIKEIKNFDELVEYVNPKGYRTEDELALLNYQKLLFQTQRGQTT